MNEDGEGGEKCSLETYGGWEALQSLPESLMSGVYTKAPDLVIYLFSLAAP